MQIKIDVTNYERCYPSRLKRYYQSNLNYKNYMDFVPYAKRAVIGNIPPEIINLFKPTERADKIKQFQSVLADTTQACRDNKEISEISEVLNSGLKEIMPQGTKSEIEYIGEGGYKKVYRLSLKDKNGEKITHDKALLVYAMNNGVYARKSHGVYAEPNSWFYLQKNIGHPMDNTQFTKHYISDMKNGYSLTEFIDEDIPKTSKDFEHNRILGLILTDRQNNPRKNKKVYDIGGMLRHSDALTDRLTLKYFKKIAVRNSQKEREMVLNQLKKKAENPKTPLRDKITAAIDYYNWLPAWYWNRTSETVPIRMIW